MNWPSLVASMSLKKFNHAAVNDPTICWLALAHFGTNCPLGFASRRWGLPPPDNFLVAIPEFPCL